METAINKSSVSWLPPYFLLALAPIFVVLVPWDFGPSDSTYRVVMAGYSLTVPIIELIIYSVLIRKNKEPIFRYRWLSNCDKLALVALAGCIAYSTFFVQIFSFAAVIGLLTFYVHLLFSLALFQSIKYQSGSALENFWIALGLATFVYAILWAIGYIAYPPMPEDWINQVPGVTNVRWTGFFWLASFSAGLVLAAKNDKRAMVAGIIFGVFGLSMTFWTGSRGALVAIIAASAGLYLFGSHFRRTILSYIVIVFAFSVSFSSLIPVPNSQYGLARILGYGQSLESLKRVDSGRIELWSSTVRLAKNEPLAGHGIDQFQRMGPKKTLGFKGPHSWPMQVLFSIGLLGFLALIYGIGRFLTLFRLHVEHPHQLPALAFFAGGSVYLLYDNFLYYTFPIAIYTVSALMIFRLRSEDAVKA